jgi:hypothetical protein
MWSTKLQGNIVGSTVSYKHTSFEKVGAIIERILLSIHDGRAKPEASL